MAKNLTPIDMCYDPADNDRLNSKMDILEETVIPGIIEHWVSHETFMANEKYKARKSGQVVLDQIYCDYSPLLCLKNYSDAIIMLLNQLVAQSTPAMEEEAGETPTPAEPLLVQV